MALDVSLWSSLKYVKVHKHEQWRIRTNERTKKQKNFLGTLVTWPLR